MADHARWSIEQLGRKRIDYLRSLPAAITLGPYRFGDVVLVHATPWSTEDVVLPDAEDGLAARMVSESRARLLLYGHIHTPYQRRVGEAWIACVGAVSGSNDSDPRPAYTILQLGAGISLQVRRVEWSSERDEPGPLPVRSEPGVWVQL